MALPAVDVPRGAHGKSVSEERNRNVDIPPPYGKSVTGSYLSTGDGVRDDVDTALLPSEQSEEATEPACGTRSDDIVLRLPVDAANANQDLVYRELSEFCDRRRPVDGVVGVLATGVVLATGGWQVM